MSVIITAKADESAMWRGRFCQSAVYYSISTILHVCNHIDVQVVK